MAPRISARLARLALVAVPLFAACAQAPMTHPHCTTNADCVVGAACVDGACVARGDGGSGDGGSGDGGSGDSGPRDAGATDMAAVDAPVCVPTGTTETMCDGRDDDCNGIVDDVDVGHDGICDCLAIGILGNPGANPSSSFQAWLTSRGTMVTRFGTAATDPIDASVLAPYDVVVLDWLPRAYTTAEADVLRDFVTAGGGVMSLNGHDGGADHTNASSLLASIGLAYPAGLLSGPVTMFATHPLTTGLTSVTFEGGYNVMTTAALTGTSTTVATLSGAPAGIAVELGTGRVFAWGDEWVEFDSQWTTMPEIAQFWTNAFGWLARPTSCRTLF